MLSSVYPTQSLKPCTTPFFFLSFHFWRLRNAQPYVCLVVCWVVGSLKKKRKEKKSIIGVFLVVCSGPRDLCELCFLLTKLHCLRRKRWNNKKRNRNKSFLVCIISLFLRVETQGSFCLFLYRFCTFFWFVFKYIYIYKLFSLSLHLYILFSFSCFCLELLVFLFFFAWAKQAVCLPKFFFLLCFTLFVLVTCVFRPSHLRSFVLYRVFVPLFPMHAQFPA